MGDRPAPDAARATVAGVAVGVVLAGLQLGQQVIGVWDAREAVIVLITVSVALAAAAATNWHSRAQRGAKLAEGLRAWPLPLLRTANPELLGVFPARRQPGGASEEYVPRDVDDEIEAAIRESSFVLLYGPARAGKTRTAVEAARRALGDAAVIVPCDADALELLLDRNLRLDIPESGIVLWLDGLERFAEALDARTLDRLLGLAEPIKVVATIRTEDWEALLAASGQRGEAAKAIAARARAFEVPPGEAEIGIARSTSGKEAGAPAATPSAAADGELRGETLAWRDAWLAAPGMLCLASLAALGIVIWTGGFEKPVPPALDDQVSEIKREATEGEPEAKNDDRHTVDDRTIELRSEDELSKLFIFEDDVDQDSFYSDAIDGGAPTHPASDEIRIYDLDQGWLREEFSFQPDATGGEAARVLLRDDIVAGDIDRDGVDEFIGAYAQPGSASEAGLPFALDWNDAEGRYRIVSLLSAPPTVSSRSEKLAALAPAYTQPITLRDPEEEIELSGYRVQDFFVDREPALRLVTGHLVELATERHGGILQLQAYQFRSGAPRLNPCEISDREIFATVPTGGTRSGAIERKWEAVSRDRNCEPP
jgi:hypothetical protein